jgi:predicted AAA+ superfamily ATPase
VNKLLTGSVGRRLLAVVNDLSHDEPVIAIHGPRSVGKSTLLRSFALSRGVEVVDLDNPAIRDAAIANPAVVVGGPVPVCLDEYQKAPDLLSALKARLNLEGSRPGTAILTGSTRQDAVPRTAEALTGRLHSLLLLPLSQGEVAGQREDLLVALTQDPLRAVAVHPESTTSRKDYVSRVCAGGFPMALQRSGPSRARWFEDYIRLTVERDAVELARIRQRKVLRSLVDRLASQTAELLDVTKAAAGLEISRTTVDSYIRLLEDLFVVQQLPAWGKTLRTRTTRLPKIHLIDSGLAAQLRGCTEAKMASFDPTFLTEFGNLLETFVVGELRKQVSWLDEPVTIGHWRTNSEDEVDFVLEYGDGRVVAFEVKANERISGADVAGLRKLRSSLGDRFIAGVAFSTGQRSYTLEDRIHVLPVDRLWRTCL